ncbi:MAG: hypothetical protein LBI60_03495 [Bacteroidales bacterium]|jgi:hypothetical protein|nr:hypothetical protein [Bacteroidales bacterium]
MNKRNIFKTKLVITGLLFIVLSVSAFAQKGKTKEQKTVDTTLVAEENLPEEVLKSHKKRYATATDAVWRFYKEEGGGIYRVNCTYRNMPSVVSYTKEGNWIETMEEWETDRLSSACIKSIDIYYQGYQINSVKRQSTENKNNDMFIVSIFEKQNIKKKLETIVYLDKSGKYIRAEEPLDTDMDDAEKNKVDKKQAKEDKKLEREFEKSRQLSAGMLKLSEDELPASIQNWVRVNYPEYLYKDIAYEEYDEFEKEGEIYQIVIQRNGINQPHATVWFTRDGDFLKLEDEFKKEEVQEETQTVVEKVKREVKPETVTVFETKYPRAKNTSWQENEDGDWEVSYTDQYGENTATFSDKSNTWTSTKTLVADINRIPSAIRVSIEKNYPKEEIKQGWSVKTPDTKPYYTVELYSKKIKESQYIDFWTNGKIKVEFHEEDQEEAQSVVSEVKPEAKPEITAAFATKYPRAKNISWEKNEDGDWEASYTDQYGKNTATFSYKSNNWTSTKTLVSDINRIPSAIRIYIDKNYPKEQLKQGWSVKTPDTKPYYTVELYSKKTKEFQYLDFWTNGKIKEE